MMHGFLPRGDPVSNSRFLGLAATMAIVVFFGVQLWLQLPASQRDAAAAPLAPCATPTQASDPTPSYVPVPGRVASTFHRVDVNSAQYKYEMSDASDNDAARDKLRHDALEAANALVNSPCDSAAKAR